MPLPRTAQGTNQELNMLQHNWNDTLPHGSPHPKPANNLLLASTVHSAFWQLSLNNKAVSPCFFFFLKKVLIDKGIKGEKGASPVVRVGEQSWGNILVCQTIFGDGTDVRSDCYQDEWISGYTEQAMWTVSISGQFRNGLLIEAPAIIQRNSQQSLISSTHPI